MAARKRLPPGAPLPHVVTCAIEHPAVLGCLNQLEQLGLAKYTVVGVDARGVADAQALAAAVTRDTVLVSLMHSNNEVGAVQPVGELAAALAPLVRVRAHSSASGGGSDGAGGRGGSGGADGSSCAGGEAGCEGGRASGHGAAPPLLLHTDAAQSLGKVPVDVRALGVDMATVVGHKFGAPKGVAALYIRRGVAIANHFCGGGQEGGRRAGTENVLLLAGLGRAAELALAERQALTDHARSLRDSLQAQLLAALPADRVRVNRPVDDSLRLPNTLSISVAGLSSSRLLADLSDRLAASSGAACHSAGQGPAVSSVLAAMGLPVEYCVGTLRLSVGRHTTRAEVDGAVALILEQARAHGVLS
ncbi:hypothetical protein FOA52_001303 [Chlamydomonas sp. UWO 241]|nr:hypothetical protein FOA52_001303 [Chlamydomonas sp. UWO 241]